MGESVKKQERGNIHCTRFVMSAADVRKMPINVIRWELEWFSIKSPSWVCRFMLFVKFQAVNITHVGNPHKHSGA
jgi:hypothetical protein